MSDPKESDDENYVSPPSLFKMITTFTKELSTHIANGGQNVSTEDYIDRLDTCNSCPHFIKKSMRCGKCGCLLQHKAKWKTSDCPVNKWAPQEFDAEKAALLLPVKKYTPKQLEKLKHAKEQKNNNTDSSNKI